MLVDSPYNQHICAIINTTKASPAMSNTKPLTRTEENAKYEEHQRKVKELMRRKSERQDWDS